MIAAAGHGVCIALACRTKMNGLNPQAYMADLLDRIHDHKINRIDELPPWNWKTVAATHAQAA